MSTSTEIDRVIKGFYCTHVFIEELTCCLFGAKMLTNCKEQTSLCRVVTKNRDKNPFYLLFSSCVPSPWLSQTSISMKLNSVTFQSFSRNFFVVFFVSRLEWAFLHKWRIEMKYFPHYCPFVRGTHRPPATLRNMQGRGGISVENMHIIDDIICISYYIFKKKSKLHTNNL